MGILDIAIELYSNRFSYGLEVCAYLQKIGHIYHKVICQIVTQIQ